MPQLSTFEQAQNYAALTRWRREFTVAESENAGRWERAAVQRAETAALADALARIAADEEATLP
jgi:hypothetical protein